MSRGELQRRGSECEIAAYRATKPKSAPKDGEPANYWEACRSINAESWQEAMDEEMKNMRDFDVWEVVPRPENHNVMSCKWVYKIKRNQDGSVARMKARLTSRGFTQREGVDFNEGANVPNESLPHDDGRSIGRSKHNDSAVGLHCSLLARPS